jgi:hypothetical protein
MRSLATSDGADRYPLNAVVALAEVVPLGTLRLGISRLIGRTRTHVRCTRLVEASDKLPPAPAAALRLPLQTGLLPVAFADTTSTRAIGAAPDHATPRMVSSPQRTC